MDYYHATNKHTGTTHAIVSVNINGVRYQLLGDPFAELKCGIGGRLKSLCGWVGSENAKTFFKYGIHTLRGVTCKKCRIAAKKEKHRFA